MTPEHHQVAGPGAVHRSRWKGLIALVAVASFSAPPAAAQLDDSCVVSALNRTAPVEPDGTWVLPNVPANVGPVRVRATCVEEGLTRAGQSGFFTVPVAGVVRVPEILFDAPEPVPERLTLGAPLQVLETIGESVQLTATASFPDGSTTDVSSAAAGTAYTSSNPAIASVDVDGRVTAQASGVVLLSAAHEGTLGILELAVVAAGDTDGDGLPDDFEVAAGLDPNDPVDALEDPDGDGLTTGDEFQAGLDPFDFDSDDDGLGDGEEVNSFGTDPRLFDSDGDGLSDGLEIATGSDPLDPASFNLAAALAALEVEPSAFQLAVNTLLGEGSRQLAVTGQLIDGTSLDLTATALGTNYASSDLAVCSFGAADGRVFGGIDGSCTVTVENSGFTAAAQITVASFSPSAVAFVDIPGFAHNVDVRGSFAFVAAGAAGLVVVDVDDPAVPTIVASLDTPGDARDVVVVGDLAALADGPSGLALVDVSNPFAPFAVGSLDTAGNAEDVVVRGGVAYVADGPAGLAVVDVADPAAPALFGTLALPGAVGVDAAQASGLAVVAHGATGISVVDVTDSTAPALLSGVDTGDARDVVLAGSSAFVADRESSFTSVDLADPASPAVRASTPLALGGRLVDVALASGFAFGADIFFVNGVPILDVADPASPVPRAILDFRGFRDDNGTGIAVDSTHVYLTAVKGSSTRLYVGQYLRLEDTGSVAPEVTLTAPLIGQEVVAGSRLAVRAEAVDDVAVLSVSFEVDGEVVFTDNSAPYGLDFAVPPGLTSLTFGASAVDLAGNVGTAEPVEVAVVADSTSPTVALTSPRPGQEVAEGMPLLIRADADDDVGVLSVSLEVDGEVVFADSSPPYRFVFTVPVGSPSLTVGASAVDQAGNVGVAQDVVVAVSPDPLTTVVGRVFDRDGGPVAGAAVTTAGGRSGITDGGGAFFISDVPTSLGDIVVSAAATLGGQPLEGTSPAIPAVAGGVTVAGNVVLVPVGAPPAPLPSPALFPGPKLSTGAATFAMAAGDIDGDGVPDLVTGDRSGDEIVLLRGLGDGSFEEDGPRISTLGPTALALVDLSLDGFDDIVAASQNSDEVAVLLSRGDGTFQAEQRTAVGDTPTGLAAADLDGDGADDLVSVNAVSGDLTILLSRGDGSFEPAITVVAASRPRAVATGDLDGDGTPDLVTISTVDDLVEVFLGLGDGTFQPPVASLTGVNPVALAVADLDLDGRGDVVTANDSAREVSVLLGGGDGTLQLGQSVPLGDRPRALAAADFDRDGIVDVVAATSLTSDSGSLVSVLLGNGDGSLQAPRDTLGAPFSSAMALADLNLDGFADLAASSTGAHDVLVLLNTGGGGLDGAAFLPIAGEPREVWTADFNLDGLADLVTRNGDPEALVVLFGRADGGLEPEVRLTAGPVSGPMAVADLDRDGVSDLLAASRFSDEIVILLANGDGTFQDEQRVPVGFGVRTVALGDLDGDAAVDLVSGTSSGFAFFFGNGDGTFQPAQFVSSGGGGRNRVPALADLDLDGRDDIVLALLDTDQVEVHLSRGDGTFEPPRRSPVGDFPVGVEVGDIDLDGFPDLVTVHSFSGDISTLLGLGDGSFLPEERVAVGEGVRAIRLADLDVDGFLDVAVTAVDFQSSGFPGTVSVLLGNGNGVFRRGGHFHVGRAEERFAIADLNGDGQPDLAVPSSYPSGLAVLLGNPRLTAPDVTPPAVTISAPAAGTVAIAGTSLLFAAQASDDVAVRGVELTVDGAVVATAIRPPYELELSLPAAPASLVLGATAVDPAGNVGAAEEVTVEVIADPLTTVAGRTVDADGLPVADAAVTTLAGLAATTAADGTFTIPGLPTISGDVVVDATATLVGGAVVVGRSMAEPPVLGGVTNVGDIVLGPAVERVDITTGRDADGDGLDDIWSVRLPNGTFFPSAPWVAPNPAWRGGSALSSGPFGGSARYPALGDGRWLDAFASGVHAFETSFEYRGFGDVWIAGEWDADNAIHIFLNGNDTGIGSSSNASPPAPWLSNSAGSSHACASPVDGHLHPNCDGPNPFCPSNVNFRCGSAADEFREIHYFEISSREHPEWFLAGVNTLRVELRNASSPGGLLITGGAGTSVLSGAAISTSPPVRACGALPGDPEPAACE